MDALNHTHEKFPGMSTCVCVRCMAVFMRSGEQIGIGYPDTRRTSTKITIENLIKAVERDNYRYLVPSHQIDMAMLLGNMCDECLLDTGLSAFLR